jgi:hypothetical protein
MSSQYPELWSALSAPFAEHQLKVKTRRTKDGATIKMYYVDAQHIQERLDTVLGPESWEFRLVAWGGDLIGTLAIRLPDGREVAKSDVGGRSKMQDSADEPKAAASHALRRCATLFGIGRYLYLRDSHHAPTPAAARPQPPRGPQASPAQAPEPGHREKERHHWDTAGHGEEARRTPPSNGHHDDRPRTGRALFAWLKGQDEQHDFGVLRHVAGWAKRQGAPERMVEWDAEWTTAGYGEACKRIQALKESAEFQESIG